MPRVYNSKYISVIKKFPVLLGKAASCFITNFTDIRLSPKAAAASERGEKMRISRERTFLGTGSARLEQNSLQMSTVLSANIDARNIIKIVAYLLHLQPHEK